MGRESDSADAAWLFSLLTLRYALTVVRGRYWTTGTRVHVSDIYGTSIWYIAVDLLVIVQYIRSNHNY